MNDTRPAPLSWNAQSLDLQSLVNEHARHAGFARAGIAPLPRLGSETAEAHRLYFEEWLARGYAGEMEYLKRKDALGRFLRSAVELAVPWARSIILCAAPYGGGAEFPLSIDPAAPDAGWIARYAWSGRIGEDGISTPSDYHKVLLRRLKVVEGSLKKTLGPFQSWASVDTGPLVERAFAAMTGVGWTGKNTCTLNEELGSFFFLGVIVTDLEVAPEQRATLVADRCGSCTRCIDACPTDALIAPREMDASRCIAYLTIEKRGPVDEALRPGMGRQVFGCDICQDVCPWNGRHRRTQPIGAELDVELAPRESLINPSLATLGALSQETWEQNLFRLASQASPLQRFSAQCRDCDGQQRESELPQAAQQMGQRRRGRDIARNSSAGFAPTE